MPPKRSTKTQTSKKRQTEIARKACVEPELRRSSRLKARESNQREKSEPLGFQEQHQSPKRKNAGKLGKSVEKGAASTEKQVKPQKSISNHIGSTRKARAGVDKPVATTSRRKGTQKQTNKPQNRNKYTRVEATQGKSPKGIQKWVQDQPKVYPEPARAASGSEQLQSDWQDLLEITSSALTEYTVVTGMEASGAPTAKSELTTGQYRLWLNDRNAPIGNTDQKEDWKADEIRQGLLHLNFSESTLENVGKVVSLAHKLVQDYEEFERNPQHSASLHELVEKFHRQLCERLWENGFGSINESDFQIDLDNAAQSNEALFQRTVMMHSTDYWRLNDMFVCETEQRWKAPKGTDLWKLPVRSTSQLQGNLTCQPDLAFYFRDSVLKDRGSSIGTLPGNLHLAVCPYEQREGKCFPFLFIEVKGPKGDLDVAQLDGLHAASRALYNMLICMQKVKKTKIFYKDVRTFSIVANHATFRAYIHRGWWDEGEKMIRFTWQPIKVKPQYSRNEIGAVVRTITIEYAQNTLLKILKETYNELRKMSTKRTNANRGEDLGRAWTQFCREFEKENKDKDKTQATSKRKSDGAPSPSTKKARTPNLHPQAHLTTSPGGSFGLGSLGMA